MDLAEKLRRQLLEQSRYIYYDTPISEATVNAYLATPRHLFVSRYREWGTREWHDVHAQSLQEHLAVLYANRSSRRCPNGRSFSTRRSPGRISGGVGKGETGLCGAPSAFAPSWDRLLDKVRQWVDLGMPTAASFALRVYPSDVPVASGENEWLVERKESKFLWSLGNRA